MSDEFSFDDELSATLYAVRFQLNGDVFLTNGSSDEAWGTGGRDADDYDVPMTETTVGESGHYVGDFDASANIGAGVYPVKIYKQAGGSPANSDRAVGRGIIYWDGTAEINLSTLDGDISSVLGSQHLQPFVYGDGE